MTFAKLYTYDKNPRGRTIEIAAKYEGLDLEIVATDPFDPVKAVEYKKKFPMGLVPALEKEDFKLTEVIAISTYIASVNNKAGLLGSNKEDAATVQQWLSWSNSHLLPALGGWFRPLAGKAPYSKAGVDSAKALVLSLTATLESHLLTRTFFVGQRITLADIMIASYLARGLEFVLDAEFRAAHPNVMRHFTTVSHQPEFLAVLGGEPTLIEKAIVFTPPKKEAAAPKAPKAPKAKEVEEEEEEPSAPAEPKAKHPAEALGAAKSFPLDEWKRQYSNSETVDALKWLEANYDAQDYSLWKVTYKYPTELTQVFMSANLVGGFHNRLEGSRKYLFGSAAVYGVANDSLIAGAYMLRGSNPTDIFDVAPDFESYEYSPLDFSKAEDRAYIAGCWSWEGEVGGKAFADGKVFK